jgi:hypothetical protein
VKYVSSVLVAAICVTASAARIDRPGVNLILGPNGSIQPQVVERDGMVHFIYFSGRPENGDVYYVQSVDFGRTFSEPVRVNHTPGSAIAIGNIRGARMAVGRRGRVHVAWNGSAAAEPRAGRQANRRRCIRA